MILLQLGLQVAAELILVLPLPISRVSFDPPAPDPHVFGNLFERYFSGFLTQSSGRETNVIICAAASLVRINRILDLVPCQRSCKSKVWVPTSWAL